MVPPIDGSVWYQGKELQRTLPPIGGTTICFGIGNCVSQYYFK
jgi:hypothetical protein